MTVMSLECIELDCTKCPQRRACLCDCHDAAAFDVVADVQARFDALLAWTADTPNPARITPAARHAAQPHGLARLMTVIEHDVALSASVGVLIGLLLSIGVALIATAVTL